MKGSQLLVCMHVAAFVLAAADVADGARGPSAPASIQTEADVVLEGTMEVLSEDAERTARLLYFLISDHRRVPLQFQSRPLNLTTGTRVRVRGRWAAGGALVVSSIQRL
jgi:hypothetical protein